MWYANSQPIGGRIAQQGYGRAWLNLQTWALFKIVCYFPPEQLKTSKSRYKPSFLLIILTFLWKNLIISKNIHIF